MLSRRNCLRLPCVRVRNACRMCQLALSNHSSPVPAICPTEYQLRDTQTLDIPLPNLLVQKSCASKRVALPPLSFPALFVHRHVLSSIHARATAAAAAAAAASDPPTDRPTVGAWLPPLSGSATLHRNSSLSSVVAAPVTALFHTRKPRFASLQTSATPPRFLATQQPPHRRPCVHCGPPPFALLPHPIPRVQHARHPPTYNAILLPPLDIHPASSTLSLPRKSCTQSAPSSLLRQPVDSSLFSPPSNTALFYGEIIIASAHHGAAS